MLNATHQKALARALINLGSKAAVQAVKSKSADNAEPATTYLKEGGNAKRRS